MEEQQGKFNWESPQPKKQSPPKHGDIRVVNLPVTVVFKWSDEIVSEYDSETDTVVERASGFIMEVLPNQGFVYKGEDSTMIAHAKLDTERG